MESFLSLLGLKCQEDGRVETVHYSYTTVGNKRFDSIIPKYINIQEFGVSHPQQPLPVLAFSCARTTIARHTVLRYSWK